MKKWMTLMALLAGTVQAGVVGGPQGGKLLENEAPRAEFFVNAERKVEVRFYDATLKVVPSGEQVVNVIAEAPTGKARLNLQRAGDVLTSAEALPAGDGYLIVVQIKANPAGKTQNFRITYHAELCGDCQRAEYACTCEHAGEEEDGQAH
jgi:hypothetical protein